MSGATDWLRPRLASAGVVAIVVIIGVITAAISYEHEYQLARRNGQAAWVAGLLPFSVDGMVAAAAVALLWASARGVRRPWQPVCVGVVGVLATIAAHMFADLRFTWLGPAVSASSGVALVLISEVAVWLVKQQRKLAVPPVPQPVAGHSCLPPPVSLAEALPMARDELTRRGVPAGEEKLADRFQVPRHRVRSALGGGRGTCPPGVPAASDGGRGGGALAGPVPATSVGGRVSERAAAGGGRGDGPGGPAPAVLNGVKG